MCITICKKCRQLFLVYLDITSVMSKRSLQSSETFSKTQHKNILDYYSKFWRTSTQYPLIRCKDKQCIVILETSILAWRKMLESALVLNLLSTTLKRPYMYKHKVVTEFSCIKITINLGADMLLQCWCKQQIFNVHESVHHNNILIYIQHDATLHSLFYLETALHVLGGPPPIIRSANNCIYSIWYLSHRYCYLPL